MTNANGSQVASATFPGGCSASNVFDPGNGTEQFNVVNASSCASPGLDIVFQPVVFWFYLNTSSPQVASVYCNPTMKVFTVGTSMDLSDGSLGPCTILQPAESTNNVTGSPQNGRPYNGCAFIMLGLFKVLMFDLLQGCIQSERESECFLKSTSH